jgi:hypothetical protein
MGALFKAYNLIIGIGSHFTIYILLPAHFLQFLVLVPINDLRYGQYLQVLFSYPAALWYLASIYNFSASTWLASVYDFCTSTHLAFYYLIIHNTYFASVWS